MVEKPEGEALRRLGEAVERSKRRSTVGLPREFARDRVGDPPSPPLARLLARRGTTQLRVYLLMLMVATEHPHTADRTAYDVATMLGLGDSEGARRRVEQAFRGLAELRLMKRTPIPGRTTRTTILHPRGDGSPWNSASLKPPYVTLPLSLWRNGWIVALSGRALSLLVVLRDLTGGRPGDSAWADGETKRQYGISEDTWTRASKELVEAGLLTVTSTVQTSYNQRRKRNQYTLHRDVLDSYVAGGAPSGI